ncbi:hypothetical protein HY624_02875 [Candidatus Uhrbacteria bacterium]|nr:hypothetical protein [Candidatus Uhrbacteria bacterium]
MPKNSICIVSCGGEGHRAQALAGMIRSEFPSIHVVTANGAQGAGHTMRDTAFDYVIIDGVDSLEDALVVVTAVSTGYRQFNGFVWSGTARLTPLLVIVPRGQQGALHGMPATQAVEEPVEPAWLIQRLTELNFKPRPHESNETRNRVVEQGSTTTITPTT